MGKDHISRRADNGIFFYVRRVPTKLQAAVGKARIKKDLGTRDVAEATMMGRKLDAANEALWAALLLGRDTESAWSKYESATRVAAAYGLSYKTTQQLLAEDDSTLLSHLEALDGRAGQREIAEAVIGAVAQPRIMLADVWTVYEEHKRAEFAGMSASQLRKHKVPRERAIAYAVAQITNKALDDITRDDVLRLRDWWSNKLLTEGLKADSLNRSFTDMKGMLATIDDAKHTSYRTPWERVRVKPTNATKAKKRPPFPADFVQHQLLAHGALDGLNDEARCLVYAMVETGLSPSEACNLRAEDIRLDAKIPHVVLPEREDRRLKTDYRARTIPLVGVSLWAFQQMPGGFPRYHDREASLSALVNKYLLARKLRPTKLHVLYSLRHTFQDRILKAKTPDRVQTDLMGHGFDRPEYGDGAPLELKREVLQQIQFRWRAPAH
jgi:integrase